MQTSATHPAAAPRLPLYLYGQTATQVSADGPALLVRPAHKAAQRYPLSRLARIISGPRVEWQSSALAICLRERLPIVFLDAAGEPTGYLLPVQGKPSRLNNDLEELLDRSDWPLHYNHWLRAERMALLQAWRQARLEAGSEIDDTEFREQVRQHVYRAETEPTVFANRTPQTGAISAYTVQILHRAGLKPRYWDEQGHPLELADDFTRLSLLTLSLEMYDLGSSLHGENAALLRVLHSFGKRIEAQLTQQLGSLHRRIKTLLEEWR